MSFALCDGWRWSAQRRHGLVLQRRHGLVLQRRHGLVLQRRHGLVLQRPYRPEACWHGCVLAPRLVEYVPVAIPHDVDHLLPGSQTQLAARLGKAVNDRKYVHSNRIKGSENLAKKFRTVAARRTPVSMAARVPHRVGVIRPIISGRSGLSRGIFCSRSEGQGHWQVAPCSGRGIAGFPAGQAVQFGGSTGMRRAFFHGPLWGPMASNT